MRTALIIATSALLAASVFGGETGSSGCPIVPTPKVYKPTSDTAELLDANAAAIVLGAKATPPERYAAKQFQTLVQRRFKRVLPVVTEGKLGEGVRQAILLGQRGTHAWLDRLCTDKGIELSAEKPGHDGFIIEAVKDGDRQAIVVGGSNPRGVTYGQHALFDLLRAEGEKVVFPVASVRDWPSIAWRGRPHWQMAAHKEPGVLDAYVRARINFTDLRDITPRVRLHGLPPGVPIKREVAVPVLREAHRRGIFVYATMGCGVEAGQFDAVLRTCQEAIELGADGLWISFDDPGARTGAEQLITRIIELGKQHGITGRRIAITPPGGSYRKVVTDFNRRAAGVPGLADATWFFTFVPSAQNARAARSIGLTRDPSWWHNWPRTVQGFLHRGGGYLGLRANGKLGYLNIPDLSVGWHSPQYTDLWRAANYTDAVMYWSYWPEEYLCGILGMWAWDPAHHDWSLARDAIYGYVFGRGQVAAARAFDDGLEELKKLFVLPGEAPRCGVNWPPHLHQVEDRTAALQILADMDVRMRRLEARAPAETLIDPARLHDLYIEPMRATLDAARTMAQLDYPEYAYAKLERRVAALIARGKTAEANQAFVDVRDELIPRAKRVAEVLSGLSEMDKYVPYWQARLSDHSATQIRATARWEALRKGVAPYIRTGLATFLAPLSAPPEGDILCEHKPSEWLRVPVLLKGPWAMDLATHEGRQALAIGYVSAGQAEVYNHVKLLMEIPVPEHKGRLVADIFVGSTRHFNKAPSGRFAQLWVNDRLTWEQELSSTRRGKEWLSIKLPMQTGKAEPVRLEFRVIMKRKTSGSRHVTFLGPVRVRPAALPAFLR